MRSNSTKFDYLVRANSNFNNSMQALSLLHPSVFLSSASFSSPPLSSSPLFPEIQECSIEKGLLLTPELLPGPPAHQALPRRPSLPHPPKHTRTPTHTKSATILPHQHTHITIYMDLG